MSELIQWPTAKYWDKAWNPVVGCKPCSPACENCYAAAWAKRFGQNFEPHYSSRHAPPRKGIVFCGNMTDLFGDWMWPTCKGKNFIHLDPTRLIGWRGGKNKYNGTYLWLTKRVNRMCNSIVLAGNLFANFKINCQNSYFGFTAENQEWYDKRYCKLSERFPEWAKMWLSCEPLLGPIDLDLPIAAVKPKWVVVGCESGPNRRPCKIEWVDSIVEQCLAANVPVFVKQLDIGGKCVTDINKFPKHLRIRQVPWAKEGVAK